MAILIGIEYMKHRPRGRTNHLLVWPHRDWLPVTACLWSRNRVKFFRNASKLHLDFHEMGIIATFFFQPGVLPGVQPLWLQQDFWTDRKIGTYLPEHFRSNRLYVLQSRRLRWLFLWQGSTYPDVQGSIGIFLSRRSSGSLAGKRQTECELFSFLRSKSIHANYIYLQAANEIASGSISDEMRKYMYVSIVSCLLRGDHTASNLYRGQNPSLWEAYAGIIPSVEFNYSNNIIVF